MTTHRKRRRGRLILAVFATLFLISGVWWWRRTHLPQPPGIRQQVLFPGIVYSRDVRRIPRPLVVHVVKIDLNAPGIRFLVTPGNPAKDLPLTARTTTQFLTEFGAQVAINGDFFYPWHSRALWDYYPHVGDPVAVEGFASSNGTVYSKGPKRPGQETTLHLSRNNRARIGPLPPGEKPYNAITGNQIIVRSGRIPADARKGMDRHPRTAVAIDRTGRYLLLIVIDGRQPGYSEGATVPEMAQIIVERGGYTALNLDGGGSATLALQGTVQGTDGRATVLNSPIDNRIPGRERPVANHLAVFAAPARQVQ
jgi:hypothetical protein